MKEGVIKLVDWSRALPLQTNKVLTVNDYRPDFRDSWTGFTVGGASSQVIVPARDSESNVILLGIVATSDLAGAQLQIYDAATVKLAPKLPASGILVITADLILKCAVGQSLTVLINGTALSSISIFGYHS